MSIGRKYILSLDRDSISFEIWKQDGMTVPTWLPFERSSAYDLYGRLKKDREFIWNMNFAHGDHGTHIVWDDMEGYSVHLLLPKDEWINFLWLVSLKQMDEETKTDWIKEGF